MLYYGQELSKILQDPLVDPLCKQIRAVYHQEQIVGIRHKAKLDEDGGHIRAPQNVKVRSRFHAAVSKSRRLVKPLKNILPERKRSRRARNPCF